MKFFSLDSPLMQGLSRMADLMWLNVLAVVCCIPIVTAGASMTALHYMVLKMVRNEECYITKGFFKSFKENFKQSTIIWLIQLVVMAILAIDFYVMYQNKSQFQMIWQVLIMIVVVLVVMTSTFVYPVLAKFDNTVVKTIKNALYISILQFPKVILMVIMSIVPIVILLISPTVTPFVLMFGVSIPAYLFAKLYNKFFQKLEDNINAANPPEETDEEDERIFKDELDPALASIRDEE